MSLKETLMSDLKDAMKQKDTVRKDTIQLVRSGVLQIEKDKQVTLDDDGVLDVIAKELKSRRDSLPEYEKSGREDLIAQLNREIEILLGYLPTQLTESEIQEIVDSTVKELNAATMKDMGKVMGVASKALAGKAEGRMISEVVKKLLNQ